MNPYSEKTSPFDGTVERVWNCCHPSGYPGKVVERFRHNGRLKERDFIFNDQYHRLDGPALEEFHENGQISWQEFWVNGKLHRPIADGPAIQSFNEDGQSLIRTFYVNDVLQVLPSRPALAPTSSSNIFSVDP